MNSQASGLHRHKDYISGCVNFSFNCQSVSLLQVYLLLKLSSSSLLAGTGGNRRRPAATGPLVFSVVRLHRHNITIRMGNHKNYKPMEPKPTLEKLKLANHTETKTWHNSQSRFKGPRVPRIHGPRVYKTKITHCHIQIRAWL